MSFNVDILSANEVTINDIDVLSGTRVYTSMISDNKIVLDSSDLTGSDDSNTIENVDGDILIGNVFVNVTITDTDDLIDESSMIKFNNGSISFIERVGQVFKYVALNKNINAFDIQSFGVYNIVDVVIKTEYNDTLVEIRNTDILPYTFNTNSTNVPWKQIEVIAQYTDSVESLIDIPYYTLSGDRIELAEYNNESQVNTTEGVTLKVGDIICVDKEEFTEVSYVNEAGEIILTDTDVIYDGVSKHEVGIDDVLRLNFVSDYRDGTYSHGLRDALLSETISGEIIYGSLTDDIIVDAGDGGTIFLGTMYTNGTSASLESTDKFSVYTSNDGTTWNLAYSNQVIRTSPHTHVMTGEGRFIKITFDSVTDGWGRIHTNSVNGEFWDLKIIHPKSKLAKFTPSIKVDGIELKPEYIENFDNMSVSLVHYNRINIDNYMLSIDSNFISHIEADLWYEVKGLV